MLADWQRDDIVRPLFGEVVWDPELGGYRRRFRIAWIELARKNGKSELLAAIALLLLVADDEEAAEIYGAAKDRDQARKVFDVAARMVVLSPVLSKRLKVLPSQKRIVDEATASYYETIAADAKGNLGHNPHGIVFDEILAQPSGDLWDSLRTGMGARSQSLMVAATTAGNDPMSFAAIQHAEMLRVQEDPHRARHIFVYARNTPIEADPWDEDTWAAANPALGDFLSVQSLRDEASEARNDPARENAFRQFRLNQWVQQATRWMPLHVWDATAGLVAENRLDGQRCWGGLDLSAVSDLTSLCWLFETGRDDPLEAVWRNWVPEAAVADLSRRTGGQFDVWVREGLVTVSEGDVLDLDAVHAQIAADVRRFAVQSLGIDRWNSVATTNWAAKEFPKLQVQLVGQGMTHLSPPTKELMRLARAQELRHGGHQLVRWCMDAVEARTDDAENVKLIKPHRGKTGKRIDPVVALVMAVDGWTRRPRKGRRAAAGF